MQLINLFSLLHNESIKFHKLGPFSKNRANNFDFIRRAFTLAEVIIVLGILGVIAEVTIPTLISNVQKQIYIVELQKAYSIFNQTLKQITSDTSCIGNLACTGFFAPSANDQTLGDQFVQYFKVAKNCGDFAVTGLSSCFTSTPNDTYDGKSKESGWIFGYNFITEDGIAFKITGRNNNCNDNYSTNTTYNMTKTCGDLYVDLNGPLKGPNSFGVDIFYFYITNGRGPLLYPVGGPDDALYGHWSKPDGTPQYCYSGETSARTCAGRIMEEGWSIKYL